MQQEFVEGVIGTVGWSGHHKRLSKQLTTVCIVCWLLFPARSTHIVRAFHKHSQGAVVISAQPVHGRNISQAQPRSSCCYVDYQNTLLELFLCTVTQRLSFPALHTLSKHTVGTVPSCCHFLPDTHYQNTLLELFLAAVISCPTHTIKTHCWNCS